MDEISETTTGDGWAATSIDSLGTGGAGMRKLRAELDVTAFGINAMVFEPHTRNRWHWHDEQQEVFVVLRGVLTLDLPDRTIQVGPGGVARVDPATHRRLSNTGDEQLVLVALGGKNGYVGRDGNMREDEIAAIGAGEGFGFIPT